MTTDQLTYALTMAAIAILGLAIENRRLVERNRESREYLDNLAVYLKEKK